MHSLLTHHPHQNLKKSWLLFTNPQRPSRADDSSVDCYSSSLYVPSVVNRSAVMDLHRSRSCATLMQSLYDIFVHSLMLSVHIVLCLPRPLLPFILPSISNRCTPFPLIICPKYCYYRIYIRLVQSDLSTASPRGGLLTCIHTPVPVTRSSHYKQGLTAFPNNTRQVATLANHVEVVTRFYYSPFINYELINKAISTFLEDSLSEIAPGYVITVTPAGSRVAGR